ncbi:MAG: hypothetical protein JWQ87_174 [Candidatus Sulfotelmatobacter sp.]|nr:hypothetical protein [Candidatus Sulfotelmatobacter sp.]
MKDGLLPTPCEKSGLVDIQEGPYRVHQEWTKRKSGQQDTPLPQAGEIVRATLVQCRSRGVRAYNEMTGIITETTAKLAG